MNSFEHFVDYTTDLPVNLNRILSPSTLQSLTQADKDLNIINELHALHLERMAIDTQLDGLEKSGASEKTPAEIKKDMDRLNSRRIKLTEQFARQFQSDENSHDAGSLSSSISRACDLLVETNLWIDTTVLFQNDARIPGKLRVACIDDVNKAIQHRTDLQKHLQSLLTDGSNYKAALPEAPVLGSYHYHESTDWRPEIQKPRKLDRDIKHIVALACTGHGASLSYFGHDGTIRSSVFDRWAGTKYTFLMGQEEINILLARNSPLAAEMHDLLELSYGHFPRHRAFETDFSDWLSWLLKELNITAEDIDLFISSDCLFVTSEFSLGKELYKWFPNAEISLDAEHHAIHQRQAFWQSGFDEAVIVTIDTCGEDLERLGGNKIGGTIAQMDRKGNCEVLRETIFPRASAGIIYSVANHHIGYCQGQEGKTMGLAPYGTPELYDILVKDLQLYPDGSFDFISNHELHKAFSDYEQKRPQKRDAEFTQKHKNIAYAAQTLLEDIITNAFKAALRLTGQKNLVFAGGIALNSVANEIACKQAQPENIYICPNPSDAGQSLGFALYGAYELAGWDPPGTEVPEYLGPTYTPDEIETAAKSTKYHMTHPENPVDIIAQCIANGHIVARYSGPAEFGPRALGNRSILADPRRKDMKDYLNSRVKHREGFRPFAPSVLLEHVSDWFDMDDRSPYMLRVVEVPDEKKDVIPAIIHVDGTARVQTVDSKDAHGYWDLINKFYKITGVPVVLNTSFNVGGKPIAETPKDAVACYESTNIDVLLLEDWVLSKRPLKEFTETSR